MRRVRHHIGQLVEDGRSEIGKKGANVEARVADGRNGHDPINIVFMSLPRREGVAPGREDARMPTEDVLKLGMGFAEVVPFCTVDDADDAKEPPGRVKVLEVGGRTGMTVDEGEEGVTFGPRRGGERGALASAVGRNISYGNARVGADLVSVSSKGGPLDGRDGDEEDFERGMASKAQRVRRRRVCHLIVPRAHLIVVVADALMVHDATTRADSSTRQRRG